MQDGQQVVMKTMTRTKLTDKDRQEVSTLLVCTLLKVVN